MKQHTIPLTHFDKMTAASIRSGALIELLRNYLLTDSTERDTLADHVLEGVVWQIEENLSVINDGLAAGMSSQRVASTTDGGIDKGGRS